MVRAQEREQKLNIIVKLFFYFILKNLTSTSKNHYKALTGIRAIAAIMIFVYHNRKYWKNDLHPEIFRFCSELNLGVQLFFVLSGFLIAKSYGIFPAQSFKNYKIYFFQRVMRIMPLYWLLVILYSFDPAFGNFNFSILHFLLLHGFSSSHALEIISQAWSLTVEMTFYVLAPFLLILLEKKLSYVLYFLSALFLVSIGVGSFLKIINGNPYAVFYPAEFVLMSTFSGQSMLFLAGILLAKYETKIANLAISKYATIIGGLGFIVLLYIIGLFQINRTDHGSNHWQGKLLVFTVLPVCIVLLFYGLMHQKSLLQKFLSSNFMVQLGNASFAFYLIHISYVNLKLRQILFLPDRNFILLWIISFLLYYFFEKPFYNWFRRIFITKP